jgi:glycosyltransferase involved in cell wall biosynthesis
VRLAVDGRVIQDRYHGIGRQALELVRVLARRPGIEVVLLYGSGPDDRLSIRDLRVKDVELIRFSAPPASLRQQLRWRSVLRRVRPDVLLVPYHVSVPWYSPVPVASIVHDCIFEEDPSFVPNPIVGWVYRALTRLALHRSNVVLTVSNATRDSVRRHYGHEIPPHYVIHNGVNPRFARPVSQKARAKARQVLGLPERYILHVGVRRPHKNQATLVKALARIDPDVHLVLVGSVDPRFHDPVPRLVREMGVENRVVEVPSVPERWLPAVFQEAQAFLFPSLVEGFGLPLIEAMAAGTPTIASAVPAVAEVARGAALLVPPDDPTAWAASVKTVLEEPEFRDELRRRGKKVASSYRWSSAAKALVAAFNEIDGARTKSRHRARESIPTDPRTLALAGTSALDEVPSLTTRARRFRGMVLVLAVVAVAAGYVLRVASQGNPGLQLPRIPNPDWVVHGAVMRGGQPEDVEFLDMRDLFDVRAVVNLRSNGSIEGWVARDFGLDYLWLSVPPGEPLTRAQLRDLVAFVAEHANQGRVVFIHDDTGLDRVPSATAMLELLRGRPLQDALAAAADVVPGDTEPFTTEQRAAVDELARALQEGDVFAVELRDALRPLSREGT